MTPETLPTDDEPNNYLEALDRMSAVYGFVFKVAGEKGLRDLLAMEGGPYREQLEASCVELASLGLTKAAGIVAEFVEDAVPEVESCPYEPGSLNAKAWLVRYLQRQRRRSAYA
jgi:hypothetical protein